MSNAEIVVERSGEGCYQQADIYPFGKPHAAAAGLLRVVFDWEAGRFVIGYNIIMGRTLPAHVAQFITAQAMAVQIALEFEEALKQAGGKKSEATATP